MPDLMIIGVIFVVLGIFLVVTKNTQFLAGYNASRVENKERLANIVGATYVVLGAIMIGCNFVGVAETQFIVLGAIAIILAQVVYVNVKLVK